jgi:hypothetical protein
MALGPGTVVTITGAGFDPGMLVEFGNQYAAVHPRAVTDDGTMMHVNVPRLATDGPVTLITPLGGIPITNPNLTFHVNSFRNVDGYSFPNYVTGPYTYADLEKDFGHQAVFQTIFPGFDLPTELAKDYLKVMNSLGAGGVCYGMSLSSQRLVERREPYSHYPLQPGLTAETVWDLNGPGGPSSALNQYLRLQQLLWYSEENLNEVLNSMRYRYYDGFQAVRDDVTQAFAAGNYPLISITTVPNGQKSPEAHAVVAYNLEDDGTGTGGFYLDVYDSNVPFVAAENSNGALHRLYVGYNDATGDHGSRIHVYANKTWSFPNLGWSGELKDLSVIRPLEIPVQPTMSISVTADVNLIPAGAAQVAQITDAAGHTLLNPDGTLNADPSTATADAVMLAPLDPATPTAPYFFLGGGTGPYTVTMRGTGSGTYGLTLLNSRLSAVFQDVATAQGQQDSLAIDPGGAVQFATTAASKALTVQLIGHAADGSESSAVLTTRTASGSTERLGFDATGRAFTYAHTGAATTYRLTLDGYDRKGRAVTLVTPALRLKSGETASFQAVDWTRLTTKGVQLTITGSNGRHRYYMLKNHHAPIRLARPVVRIHHHPARPVARVHHH